MREKGKYINIAVEKGWISFFEHDPEYTTGTIILENGKPKFVPREA